MFNGKRFVPYREETRSKPYQYVGVYDHETDRKLNREDRPYVEARDQAIAMNTLYEEHAFAWQYAEDEPEASLEFRAYKAVVSASSGGYSALITFPDGTTTSRITTKEQGFLIYLSEALILEHITHGN